MKTAYYTVDGEIVGEATNGVRLDYLTDALGSVTAKVDQATAVVSSARYKPYGDLLVGSKFVFGWVGSSGCRISHEGLYIRARHYSSNSAIWISIDNYWPEESAYVYCSGNTINKIDPSGNSPSVKLTRVRVIPTINAVCGNYYVDWKFVVAPNATGYIVQKIISILDIYNCDSTKAKYDPCGQMFYEIWKVKNGKVASPSSKTKKWSINSQRDDAWGNIAPGACTWGHAAISGELTFIPGNIDFNIYIDEKMKKMGFSESSHIKCSLALPSTRNFNKPANSTAWQARATLFDMWGCCKKREEQGCKDNLPLCKKCPVFGPCFDDIFSVSW